MSDLLLWIGPWLLAYLGHSTVWLGCAWLATRLRPGTASRTRETIWRTALLGSLVSPSLALFVFAAPLQPIPAVTASERPVAAEDLAAVVQPVEVAPLPEPSDVVVALPPSAADDVVTPAAEADGNPLPGSMPSDPAVWLPWVWAPIALFALAGSFLAHFRLLRVLRSRKPLREGTLPRRLERMAASLRPVPRVRLSVSDRIAVPVVFGLRRREICLPRRAVSELDPVLQSSMLGHELHHLQRRDPLTLAAVQLLARLLWLQPLNLVALRALRLTAEEECDAWAAGRTGDPVAMASCLGEVAGWLLPHREPLPEACMARPGSPLAHRIDRLLDAEGPQALMPTAPRGMRLRAASTLAAGALLLPTLLPASPPAPELPILLDEELPLETRTFALSQEIDLIQAEIHQLQAELQTRGDAGAAAAARLGALESRLTRLQGLLTEALTVLPAYQEFPAVPVN